MTKKKYFKKVINRSKIFALLLTSTIACTSLNFFRLKREKLQNIITIKDENYRFPITVRINEEIKNKPVHVLILLHGVATKDRNDYMFSERINIVEHFDSQIRNKNIEPTILVTLNDLKYSGQGLYWGLNGKSVTNRIESILEDNSENLTVKDFSVFAYSGSGYLYEGTPSKGINSFIKTYKDLRFIALADSEISKDVGKYLSKESKKTSMSIYTISRSINARRYRKKFRYDVDPKGFASQFGARPISLNSCNPTNKNIIQCYATKNKKMVAFKSKNSTHHQMPRELLEEVLARELTLQK